MDDKQMIALLFDRNESVLAAVQEQYGSYCRTIAQAILADPRDVEEVLNDAYAALWKAVPPARPQQLSTYLGKITRQLALHKRRDLSTARRGGGEVPLSLAELEDCVADLPTDRPEQALEKKELAASLNAFLETLSPEHRKVFVCRYWYFDSVEQIAQRFGIGKSKVKMILKRTREKLAVWLRQAEYRT